MSAVPQIAQMKKKPKHRVSLPPVGIPLLCKNNRRIRSIQPAELSLPTSLPDWRWMKGGDVVMLIKTEFIGEARFETHDLWKLSFYHKGELIHYLWHSHELFVPRGRALNNWVDFWEPLKIESC